jgi:hypothetical protein
VVGLTCQNQDVECELNWSAIMGQVIGICELLSQSLTTPFLVVAVNCMEVA